MTTAVTPLVLAPTAQGLLDWVETSYANASRALPERKVIVPGAPGVIAWDCEQLTVALASITTGGTVASVNILPQIGSGAGVGLLRQATWSIQVVRCSATTADDGAPPSVAELDAAAMTQLDDAGMLSQALVNLVSAQLRPEWLPPGAVVNAGQVATLGPEGGFQAVEATVTLSAMQAS
jgi:hypothetical protein